jgi:Do/DeqQ family serine protease
MKNIAKIFLISTLGGVLTLGLYKGLFEEPRVETIIQNVPVHSAVKTNSRIVSPLAETSFTFAAEKTVNSVVHVKTAIQSQYRQPSSPFEFFFGAPGGGRPQIQMGSGSGVIVSKDGYIVTNNHVIEGAQKVQITLNDGRDYDADLIGTDPTTDIALLKIAGENLPFLTFSNSDEVKLGEWVLAVGNPFNLTSTVTAGIVSAKSRNIGVIDDRAAIESFIQTDAAVNPGNSGGALVNTGGELIGINSAISTHTGSFEGYSFAVPSNIVKKVIEDLLEFGTVQRAFIGVNISDITTQVAERLELKETNGVYVGGVTENGAAENAGIETGDIIVAIDNKKVTKSSELQEIIGRKRPGDEVKVSVNRDGDINNFNVTLRNINGNTRALKLDEVQFMTQLGGSFSVLTQREKARLGITYGVRVTSVKSGILDELNVPDNFIITHINRNKIRTLDDINTSVNGLQKDDPVVLQGYLPTGRAKYYAFGY